MVWNTQVIQEGFAHNFDPLKLKYRKFTILKFQIVCSTEMAFLRKISRSYDKYWPIKVRKF